MSLSSTLTYPSLLQAYYPKAASGLFRKAMIVVLGSVALAVSAKITLPFGIVPFTMHTYVVMVLGALLGARLATAATLLYLAEGLAGLPVFTAGGGLAYVASPTFGYILGFIAAAFVIGYLTERGAGRSIISGVAIMILGHAIIFAFGLAFLSASLGFEKAYLVGLAPFWLPSIFKTLLAAVTVFAAWKIKAK